MDWEYSECLLCDVVANEPWVPYSVLFPSYPVESQILLETSLFIVVPDIAPIVEGYCLIVAKRHVPAMNLLSGKEKKEFEVVKKITTQAISKVYGSPVAFEHGQHTFSHNAGACIDHAHLHICPTSEDLLPYLSDQDFFALGSDIGPHELQQGHGYLFFENQCGKSFMALVERCQQQYFRRKLSMLADPPVPWNWRDFIRYANVLPTKERLRRAIDNLGDVLSELWCVTQFASRLPTIQ